MLVRLKYETDGKCCHLSVKRCTALSERYLRCGSYLCPFYKPEGCGDWIRIDRDASVEMYEPGERV